MAGRLPEPLRKRLRLIADLAEHLAERQAVGRVLDIPAVIESLPEHKVTWSFEAYGDDAFDGLIEYVPPSNGFHIHCNKDRCESIRSGRARFTLAHELGHYQIDEHRAWLRAHAGLPHPCFCFRSDRERKVQQEREADHFAAHFLLPSAWLKKDFGTPAPDGQVVVDVARAYRLSLQAAALRIVQDERLPSAMVVWSPSGRREWGWMSDLVWQIYARLLTHGQGLPDDCPTRRLIRSPQPAGTVVKGEAISDLWFPYAAEDQFTSAGGLSRARRDVIIKEHAISLGRFGVLTFLSGHEWMRLKATTKRDHPPSFWGF